MQNKQYFPHIPINPNTFRSKQTTTQSKTLATQKQTILSTCLQPAGRPLPDPKHWWCKTNSIVFSACVSSMYAGQCSLLLQGRLKTKTCSVPVDYSKHKVYEYKVCCEHRWNSLLCILHLKLNWRSACIKYHVHRTVYFVLSVKYINKLGLSSEYLSFSSV